MIAAKTVSALLVLGFAALPLASADAAPRHTAPRTATVQVVEGRNAAYFNQTAANANAAIEEQAAGNARSTH